MSDTRLVFNGINGATGGYLLPPLTVSDVARVVRGHPLLQSEERRDLSARAGLPELRSFRLMAGVSPADLSWAGWGVVFPEAAEGSPQARRLAEVREALSPLLKLRKAAAASKQPGRYRELTFRGAAAGGPESKYEFLARLGSAGGAVDPDRLPYYLLLVGGPEEIPFSFQYQLDIQYAVGRICFDTPEEYATYARGVVQAEQGKLSLRRRVGFWGPRTQGDPATELSSRWLLPPLQKEISDRFPEWEVASAIGENATRDNLARLLGGSETPALLLTAGHGLYYPPGHPLHASHCGALLCGEWRAGTVPSTEQLFAGDDLSDDARVGGLVAFFFACYGAGVPAMDTFSARLLGDGPDTPAALARDAFVTRLPRRLLGHPGGGALAVIGHVDRAWGSSFMLQHEDRLAPQVQVFQSALTYLLKGLPVGCAMDFFNERYAEAATMVAEELEEQRQFGAGTHDDAWLARRWLECADARNYVVLGDPAVRLSPGETRDTLNLRVAQGPQRDVSEVGRTSETPAQPREAPPLGGADRGSRAVSPDAPSRSPEAMTVDVPESADRDPASPGPASTEPEQEPPLLDFGVSGRRGRQPTGPLAGLAAAIEDRLGELLRDLTELEVRTFVSDELPRAAGDHGQDLAQVAQLRALTRIRLDGDMDICVPRNAGRVDRALWELHSAMVKEAQAHRTEMLRMLLSLLGPLAR